MSTTTFRLRKLPASAAKWVMPLLLSIFMSGLVSLLSNLHAQGLHAGLLMAWLSSWAFSWVVAFPVLLLILPVVKKLTALIVEVH
jgi:hypothetical protein